MLISVEILKFLWYKQVHLNLSARMLGINNFADTHSVRYFTNGITFH